MSKDIVPRPNIESVQLVEQVAQGLIADYPLDSDKRKQMEHGLHDATNKKLLFIEALRIHAMNYHSKILGAKNAGLQYLGDPRWLGALARNDPGKFLKAMDLLEKMDDRFTKFYLETAGLGQDKNGTGGFDAKQVFNVFFGAGSQAILPDQFKDPETRREFRELAQGMVDFLKGKDIPAPPKRESRVLQGQGERVEILSDAGHDEPGE